MRAIDADKFMKILDEAIHIIEAVQEQFNLKDDEFTNGELKAYNDIRDGLRDFETLDEDMVDDGK